MIKDIARGVRRRLSNRLGGDVDPRVLATFSEFDRSVIEAVRPYTMTTVMRIVALIDTVRYCEKRRIPGAYAECGVWKGGSVLAMILTLLELGVTDRDIWLYDTFEGMTAPTERDVFTVEGLTALEVWQKAQEEQKQAWGEMFRPEIFNEDMVRKTLESTGYPAGRLHFVRGPVEETIPKLVPDQIALLRLDTDWYESTLHEMRHLYPLLADGGVLIIDDYDYLIGCRQAVDEFFADESVRPVLLNRVDHSGRLAIKC